jgi:hypothetical protein
MNEALIRILFQKLLAREARPFHIAPIRTTTPNRIKNIVVSDVLSNTSNFSLIHAGKKMTNGISTRINRKKIR